MCRGLVPFLERLLALMSWLGREGSILCHLVHFRRCIGALLGMIDMKYSSQGIERGEYMYLA